MRIKAWLAASLFSATGFFAVAAIAQAPAPAASAPAPAVSATPAPNGESLFTQHCKSCHEPPIQHAPSRATIATFPRASVVAILTDGVMAPMAKGLSKDEIAAVAAYLTPSQDAAASPRRRRTPAGPVGVDKMCEVNPPIHTSDEDWRQIGHDADTTRYQPQPGFTAAEVPRLKLKWAYTMTGGGQPTVVGDWLFVTNRTGKLYALDAKTGCAHWIAPNLASRSAPMVIKSAVSPSGWATFIGVGRQVHALDAQTGKEIWKSEALETHIASSVGGALAVSDDKVFVPFSSGEEPVAMQPTYPCCSFRGSVVALDIKTGKQLWKTFTINEPVISLGKNPAGVERHGPAGGAIWSAPTADAKRGLVYVATGDSYTDAPTKGDDALMAIEMKTGKIRWSTQVTERDNYIMGCEDPAHRGPNCNSPQGPDYDFGSSPVLFTDAHGRQVLVDGQKSGIAYGFNPDTGKLLWKTQVGPGSALGGIEWGVAVDKHALFVPISDVALLFNEGHGAPGDAAPKPGLSALNPFTGNVLWFEPAPKAPCHYAGDRSSDYVPGVCMRAQSQAPATMPGVVFSGTMDGWFRAYDARTGKVLWAYSTTAQTYDTVNAVKDQPGGSIDGYGPVIAGGMVYTMSGFNGAANTGGNGNNVLLAFSVDGK
jgi:polyvinyl alcohol dehydrogenase (cytochrome)